MHLTRKLFFQKRINLFAVIVLTFVSAICVAFTLTGSDDFVIARREVLLRRIGDELLLQSGDSKSRVLPIKKIAENEYQISFENKLTFQPDSLVNTTRRVLAKDPLVSDFVVSVLKCENASVAYGFAISGNRKDDIVPCRGRGQLTACYMINIKLKPINTFTSKKGYLLGSLPLLAFVGFIFLRSNKPRKTFPEGQDTGMFSLSRVLFDAKNRKININGKTISLTGTETRVLIIFASSPNETIERSRLQKEIWEDEGIIVGRSLDMFISKLRKKLELDPNIKIAVIRGKGYMLEIGV